jgi:hypothetical protein
MTRYSINGTELNFESTGSDYRIEKSSSTIGYARKAGSDWRIESSNSSTIGYVRTGRSAIEGSNSSTLSSVSSAPGSGPDYVKGAFFLLKKEGKI